MKTSKLFFILTAIISAIFVNAQPLQTISGKVSDTNQQPLAFANVIVFSDSTFIDGTITDDYGNFKIENSQTKANYLKISLLGYKSVNIAIPEDGNIGIIELSASEIMLNEVVVKGNLQNTRIIGSSLITDIENSILSSAGTANDVLSHIPLVNGKDGSFTVLGRGTPEIYINGRLVRNSIDLEQLSSDMIKSVEVISNPGAKYAAEVNAVIKIKTKKPQGEGFGVELRSNNYFNHYFRTSDQMDLKFRTGGLELFGTGFINHGKRQESNDFYQTTYSDEIWSQQLYENNVGKITNWSWKTGFSYQINENHSFGAYYKYGHNKSRSRTPISSNIFVNEIPYDNWNSIDSTSTHETPCHEANLYYSGSFGKLGIDFNADYIKSTKSESSAQTELSENFNDRLINTYSSNRNRLFAEKLTFSYPIGKGQLDFGEEYTDSHISYTNKSIGTDISDSNNDIKEQNIATFAEYSQQLGPIGLSVGARYEHVSYKYYSEGHLLDNQSRTYNNIFPSLSLSTKVRNVNLSVNFTNRIRRPSYSQLDGNMVYINRMTYQSGNPYLKPVKMYTVQAMALWKTIYAQIIYNHEVNSIFYTMGQFENDPLIRYITYENIPHYNQMMIAVGAHPTISIWHPQPQIAIMQQWYKALYRGHEISLDNPILFLTLNNAFQLPGNLWVNLDFTWQSEGSAQNGKISSKNSLDFSIYKSFFNDRFTVKLKGTDLLNKNHQQFTIYNNDIHIKSTNYEDSRSLIITLTYKFNASRNKYRGTGAGEAEKQRLDK